MAAGGSQEGPPAAGAELSPHDGSFLGLLSSRLSLSYLCENIVSVSPCEKRSELPSASELISALPVASHGLASLAGPCQDWISPASPSLPPLLPWARILGGVEAAGLVVAMCASGILIINYTTASGRAEARALLGTLS